MKVLVIGRLTGKDIRPHLQAEGRRVAELRNDTNAHDAPTQLASLPFLEHDLVTFEYIELDDNSPA